MKKIMFITHSFGGGGAERALILVLQNLDRTRFKPVVVVFNEGNAYEGHLPDDVELLSLGKKGRLDNLRLPFSLAGIIRRQTPDIICSTLPFPNCITALARRIAGLDIPLILTEQGNLSWTIKNDTYPHARSLLIKGLYPGADHIIAVSTEVKDDLIKHWRARADRITVIYNPVDIGLTAAMSKEEAEHPWLREGREVIAACGRLTRQKNYPLLLRAMALVSKERPDARLVILGEGGLKDSLTALAAELGISEKVAFLGFQKNPFGFIARARVFALSSFSEGLPLVLIEAMACGTPAISTRVGGSEEVITDGVNGLLVPQDDERALAKAVIGTLNDEPFGRRLAEAGMRRAQDFNAAKIAGEYEKTFDHFSRGIAVHDDCASASPFFIIGVQRSGTTLLRLILNAHPGIAIPEESEFLKPLLKMKNLNRTFAGDELKNLANYLRLNPHLKLWGCDFEAFLSGLRCRSGITLKELISGLYSVYCRQHGKQRWGDKNSSLFRKVDVIRGVFPDAKFIHIVRDGRDVFDSWRKMDPSKGDAGVIAVEWAYRVNRMERAMEKIPEGNRITIRYEDLIEKPEDTVRKVCAIIGVSYDPKMLEFHRTSHDYIGEHHSRLIFGPIDAANKGKWEKLLSAREAAIFDLFAGHYLRKYRYPLHGSRLKASDIAYVTKSFFLGLARRLFQVFYYRFAAERALKHGTAVNAIPIGLPPKGEKNRQKW